MFARLIGMLTMGVCLLGIPMSSDAQTTVDRSYKREFTQTYDTKYLLRFPKDYKEGDAKKWPLLVFLHGAGERGEDVQRVKIHGPIKVSEKGTDLPFIIAAPLCPPDTWWNERLWELITWIDELERTLPVDKSRVYLTGLSMGGFGTWALANKFPDRFAAIAPVCGGGNPLTVCALKDKPIWVFHGQKDETVPFERSEEMVKALKEKCQSTTVKFTVYPEAGHDSWTETYNNPDLYEWFLKHKTDR